jgi:hypothetical protein
MFDRHLSPQGLYLKRFLSHSRALASHIKLSNTDWVSENRVLRRICAIREMKWQEAGKNCIMRSSIIYTIHQILLRWRCFLVEIDRRFRAAYCLHYQDTSLHYALIMDAVWTSETSAYFNETTWSYSHVQTAFSYLAKHCSLTELHSNKLLANYPSRMTGNLKVYLQKKAFYWKFLSKHGKNLK